jgi:hypothetical protein
MLTDGEVGLVLVKVAFCDRPKQLLASLSVLAVDDVVVVVEKILQRMGGAR